MFHFKATADIIYNRTHAEITANFVKASCFDSMVIFETSLFCRHLLQVVPGICQLPV